LALQADVAKVADIDRVMSQVQEAFGRIDILFANAGISEVSTYSRNRGSIF
jgi:NAD(P)-dependent dehydrogenase (short-subunit alcohol dehydrogenase family)